MESSYFGRLGNGRCGSSRRGKKSSSDKQKQPQRGLGVAQLEKIRLQNEMMVGYHPSHHPPFPSDLNKEDLRVPLAYQSSTSSSTTTSSSLLAAHPNIMAGFGGSTVTDIRYGELYPGATSRSLHDPNDVHLQHHLLQPTMTLPLIDQSMENKIRHDRRHSIGSVSQGSDSSNSPEVDLELKLSL